VPKGKEKGKEKSKGKAASECASETPDGKKFCYRWNDQARGCNTARCNFLHVCGKCSRDHSSITVIPYVGFVYSFI
jgi:hypothetical protein